MLERDKKPRWGEGMTSRWTEVAQFRVIFINIFGLLVTCRGSSEESTKASLPNLTTPGIQINISGSASSPRDEIILDDIQESPTPSALEISNASSETSAVKPKILNLPKIELDCDLIESTIDQPEMTTKSLREKRQIKVKTPKSYFLESFQKRKKSFRKSSQKCSEIPEKEFTDLEALNPTTTAPPPEQLETICTKKPNKKFWSAPSSVVLKAHKYVVEYPPKTLQWSSNMQQKYNPRRH